MFVLLLVLLEGCVSGPDTGVGIAAAEPCCGLGT